ncbi:MAG: hypothetical protein A3J72_10100 [Nitrospirae bacterium RIFCSPHIGHO2_02_FULL_40_19]|nr:MAG: hypothetical protein A3J72_10100 [Nitrospirae bacterium RIFCSPHIGHO2_02_FULL_40_19]
MGKIYNINKDERRFNLRTATKKVSDITVDELKTIIHEVIAEDLEAWRETFEIMADKKLMAQIKQSDTDWRTGKKEAYVSWDELKSV